jgi:signal transduction histidine kinase
VFVKRDRIGKAIPLFLDPSWLERTELVGKRLSAFIPEDGVDDLNMFARPQIAFEANKGPAGCRPEQSVGLFRTMQEALVNVAKHANASAGTVQLIKTDTELILTVTDTGKGFDKDARETAPAGFGMIIMRERIRALGGRFAVQSRPGQGTTVTAAVPLRGGRLAVKSKSAG